MGGVYGEFLGFFPELMETFEIYKYKTLRDSGYELTFSRKISAIRQTRKANIDEYRYKQLPVMDIEKSYYVWTSQKLVLEDEFIKIDDELYRPMETSAFVREGGFWETRVDKIIGNDGTKENDDDIIGGDFNG
jgi:hypothetical protein